MRSAVPVAAAAVLLVASLAAQGPPPVGQAAGGRGRGAGAAPEPPRTGTGLVVGRVVEGTSSQPVTGAVVDLVGAGVSAQRVRVDADGRFLFRDLPGGEFMLVASKPGYLGGASGQRLPNGPTRPLELGDGEKSAGVTLRLWKYGVIAGTVSDDHGETVSGLQVTLIARVLVDGRRRLAALNNLTATTDDRGTYRFALVAPGEYVVAAQSSQEQIMRSLFSIAATDMSVITTIAMKFGGVGNPEDMVALDPALKVYPPTFYPSAPLPSQATAVRVQAGEERTNVDIRTKLIPVARFAGTLVNQGQPLPRMSLQLLLPDEPGFEMQVSNAMNTPDGRFSFLGVPSGRYMLRGIYIPRPPLQPVPAGGRGRGGAQPFVIPPDPLLSVGAPITAGDSTAAGLTLPVQRGLALRGRVEFEGAALRPAAEELPQMVLSVLSADGSAVPFAPTLRGRVEPDGTLATIGVPPGRYRVSLRPPAPWRVKSAMTSGRDVVDAPLDVETSDVPEIVITLTDQPAATLSGTVRNAQGTVDRQAAIVIFPADVKQRTDFSPTSRRMRAARTTTSGVYAIPDLPGGDYIVVAGGDEILQDWLELAALERLTRQGTRVTIAEGERKSLDLRSGGAR